MLFFPAPANGEWSTGLCEWCAQPGGGILCIHVYNNKCCIYGTIVEQLHPSEVACSGSFCGACWLYAIVPPPCSWYMHMSVRQAIKRKYGIKPEADCCDDWVFPIFCEQCAMCQEARELAIHKHRSDIVATVQQTVQVPMQQMVQVPMQQMVQVPMQPGYGGQFMMVPDQPFAAPQASYPLK